MTNIVVAFFGAIVAIIGWFISASLLRKKEIETKKREIVLQYLIESYRRLEGSSNRYYSHDSQFARDYEAAIADIQLYGTEKRSA